MKVGLSSGSFMGKSSGKPSGNVRFSLLHGLYWASFCVLYSFLVPLYRSYGFSEITIGFLSMTGSLASMIIQPLWGLLSDKLGSIKGIFIGTVLVSILVSYGTWLGRFGSVWMFPVIFLIASTYMSMGTMLDSWVMKMTNQGHPVRYNITRGIGSLAFALTSQIFGQVLDVTGLSIIPYVFTGMALLMVGLAATTTAPVHQTVAAVRNPFSAIGVMFGNRRFMVLMGSLLLCFVGNGAAIVFMPVRMAELGGTNLHVGTALMVMALSETPAMLLHHRLVRFIRNDRLLTISLFFFIVKITVLALALNPTMLILAQMFQFLSFGLYMPSVVHEINSMVSEQQLTTALLVYASLTFGLGIMIGSSLGGIFADRFGVQAMLLMMAAGPTLGLVLRLLSGIPRQTVPSGGTE